MTQYKSPYDKTTSPLGKEETRAWLRKAGRLLEQRYGITLDDCTSDGLPPESFFDAPPEEFVDWVGEKYDLDTIGDYW